AIQYCVAEHWNLGSVVDVLNMSGHRIGTAEVESALVLNDWVAEAAVVGCPHDIKGQAIYAYVMPMQGVTLTEDILAQLKVAVSEQVGAFARPDYIQVTSGLPKTRSGKIMRRILR